MAALRFYLDENVQVAVGEQLRLRGIEAVSVRDLAALGESDQSHLARATALGYVLCTHDTDYVRLASEGAQHAGIIIGQQDKHTIGDWVKGLTLYHTLLSDQDMLNRVDYL